MVLFHLRSVRLWLSFCYNIILSFGYEIHTFEIHYILKYKRIFFKHTSVTQKHNLRFNHNWSNTIHYNEFNCNANIVQTVQTLEQTLVKLGCQLK